MDETSKPWEKTFIVLILILWSLTIIPIIQFVSSSNNINNIDLEELNTSFRGLRYNENGHYFDNLNSNNEKFIEIERKCFRETFKIDSNASDHIYVFSGSSMVTPFCEKKYIPLYLENIFEQENNQSKKVYNLAKSGARSTSIVKSLNKSINMEKPEMVLIYSGHNDHFESHNIIRDELDLLENNLIWYLYRKTFLSGRPNHEIEDLKRNTITPYLINLGMSVGIIDSEKVYDIMNLVNENALDSYKTNMEKIVEITERKGVETVFITVSSNLKIRPFEIDYDFVNETSRDDFINYRDRGFEDLNKQNYEQAIENFKDAEKLNSKNAMIHYKKGLIYEELGETDKSLRSLRIARDKDDFSYDVRAKSSINNFIRSLNGSHVTVVDLKKLLKEDNNKLLFKPDLFDDWVHFNSEYNEIIAKKIFKGLEESSMVN